MLQIVAETLTETGGRMCNEDSVAHRFFEQHAVFALADGAGGHGGGDLASTLAVETILDAFGRSPAEDAGALASLVKEVNRQVLNARAPGTVSQDMHSTLTVLAVDPHRHVAYWAHVGDTRLYHFRNDAIVAKTIDHSLAQALVAAGLLDPAQANEASRRSTLTSSLGCEPEDLVVTTSANIVELNPGDWFLICSDGLWEHVPEQFLSSALAHSDGPKNWLALLRQQVQEAVYANAGHDNFSAVAVKLSS